MLPAACDALASASGSSKNEAGHMDRASAVLPVHRPSRIGTCRPTNQLKLIQRSVTLLGERKGDAAAAVAEAEGATC